MPESVWDYPRPPRVEPSDALIEIDLDGNTIVSTRRALRVLETSHPPAFYIPQADVAPGTLEPVARRSFCEFKGMAHYFDVIGAGGRRLAAAAWGYANPAPGYESLIDHVAFYPSPLDECRVDGEVVQAQQGDFYGGWITSGVTGPFKGGPGTRGW